MLKFCCCSANSGLNRWCRQRSLGRKTTNCPSVSAMSSTITCTVIFIYVIPYFQWNSRKYTRIGHALLCGETALYRRMPWLRVHWLFLLFLVSKRFFCCVVYQLDFGARYGEKQWNIGMIMLVDVDEERQLDGCTGDRLLDCSSQPRSDLLY